MNVKWKINGKLTSIEISKLKHEGKVIREASSFGHHSKEFITSGDTKVELDGKTEDGEVIKGVYKIYRSHDGIIEIERC